MKLNIFINIYKKIVQLFFYFLYGKIKIMNKTSNKKFLKIHKIIISKKHFYNIYSIDNARIYSDRIDNFAIIHNNALVTGPSYQLKNNNFSSIKNNSVLKTGTPKFKRIVDGTVLSLLSGGGANSNYFHWLFDVLPRLYLVSKIYNLKNIDYFLVPSFEKKFQIDTLKMLGFKKERILDCRSYRHFNCKKIISADHPYMFNTNKLENLNNIPIWISKFLKNNFLKCKIKGLNYKKIYIDRKVKDVKRFTRLITNNNKIKFILKKNGFKILYMEDYTISEQISIVNNAKIICGLHGAAFANIVFCKKNTFIVEMTTKTTGDQIKNLSKKNKLKYIRIEGVSKGPTHYQNGPIEIDINLLKKIPGVLNITV